MQIETTIRSGSLSDLRWARLLNEREVPRVNDLAAEPFETLALALAARFRVAERGQDAAGFAIVLPQGVAYRSENYLWFSSRYERFLYLDRILVDPAHRRRGVASALYEDLFAHAQGVATVILCEVNIQPPNPGSLQLHTKLGFREVGRQQTEHGKKEVSLLAREIHF